MKKIFFLLAVIAMMIQGCEEDCGEWKAGDSCKEVRSFFYDTYSGDEFFCSSSDPVTFDITAYGSDIREMSIDGKYFIRMTGYADDKADFDVPAQTAQSGSLTFTIVGDGSINDRTGCIVIHATVNDGSGDCDYTLTGCR